MRCDYEAVLEYLSLDADVCVCIVIVRLLVLQLVTVKNNVNKCKSDARNSLRTIAGPARLDGTTAEGG